MRLRGRLHKPAKKAMINARAETKRYVNLERQRYKDWRKAKALEKARISAIRERAYMAELNRIHQERAANQARLDMRPRSEKLVDEFDKGVDALTGSVFLGRWKRG